MPRRKDLLLFASILVLVNLLPVVYIATSDPNQWAAIVKDQEPLISPTRGPFVKSTSAATLPLKARGSKLILFAGFPDFYRLPERCGPGGLSHCDARNARGEMMRCELTVDISRFSQADAVIFYSHRLSQPDQLGFKAVKQPGSTWTFFALESPTFSDNSVFGDPMFHDKFNSTMTYRTDSEFWHGYVSTQVRESPLSPVAWRKQEAELRRSFRKKTKLVAVFVSHCNAPSRRDDYVQRLRRYISVDIYGACGSLSCEHRETCDSMLARDYKFYLAFENSHCRDYVTEKLLRVLLSRRVIPVVRGGADYDTLFPRNSVIDTAHFESPFHLARHLRALASNEDEWVKMFRWLWHWEVRGPDLPVCQYCHHLYSQQRSSNLYHNVYEWWSKGTCYNITDL